MTIHELREKVENSRELNIALSKQLLYSLSVSYTDRPESSLAKEDLEKLEKLYAASKPPVFNINGRQYTSEQICRIGVYNETVEEVIEKIKSSTTLSTS